MLFIVKIDDNHFYIATKESLGRCDEVVFVTNSGVLATRIVSMLNTGQYPCT